MRLPAMPRRKSCSCARMLRATSAGCPTPSSGWLMPKLTATTIAVVSRNAAPATLAALRCVSSIVKIAIPHPDLSTTNAINSAVLRRQERPGTWPDGQRHMLADSAISAHHSKHRMHDRTLQTYCKSRLWPVVARLVEPELAAAGQRDVRDNAPATVRGRLAGHASRLQPRRFRLDIVAHEPDLMDIVLVRLM